jgi:hypothetical protein
VADGIISDSFPLVLWPYAGELPVVTAGDDLQGNRISVISPGDADKLKCLMNVLLNVDWKLPVFRLDLLMKATAGDFSMNEGTL